MQSRESMGNFRQESVKSRKVEGRRDARERSEKTLIQKEKRSAGKRRGKRLQRRGGKES